MFLSPWISVWMRVPLRFVLMKFDGQPDMIALVMPYLCKRSWARSPLAPM